MKKLFVLFTAVSLVLCGCELNLSNINNEPEVTEQTEPNTMVVPSEIVIPSDSYTNLYVSKIVSYNEQSEEIASVEFYYDESGRLLRKSMTDFVYPTENIVFDIEYDYLGRRLTEMSYSGDTLLDFTTYEYVKETRTWLRVVDILGNSLDGQAGPNGEIRHDRKQTYNATKIRHCNPNGELIFDGVTENLLYDDNGNLQIREVLRADGEVDTYAYRYGSDGKVSAEICDTEDVSYDIYYNYDSEGRIISSSYYDYKKADESHTKTISYEENDGIITETAVYDYWLVNERTETVVTVYNEYGTLSYVHTYADGLEARTDYTYNENGFVTKCVSTDKNGQLVYSECFDREYDENGNITKNITYKDDGSIDYLTYYECSGYHGDIPSVKTCFDENGNVSHTFKTEFDPQTGKISYFTRIDSLGNEEYSWKFVYYKNGELNVKTYFEKGQFVVSEKYEYIELERAYHQPYYFAKNVIE